MKAALNGAEATFAGLAAQASRFARAAAVHRLLARRDDPRRWRRAALLWPLNTKD